MMGLGEMMVRWGMMGMEGWWDGQIASGKGMKS